MTNGIAGVWKRRAPGSLLSSLVLMATSALVALTVTLRPTPAWADAIKAPHLPLFAYLLLLALLFVSLALSDHERPREIAFTTLLLLVPGASVACSIASLRYPLPAVTFWIMLFGWTALAVVLMRGHAKGWSGILLILATIWTVSGIICMLGEVQAYPYSRDALGQREGLQALLDVRVVTSLVFAVAFLLTAVVRAFAQPRPNIRSFTKKQLLLPVGTVRRYIAALLTPIVLIVNVGLRFACVVVNLLWKAGAYLCVYLWFTSREAYWLLKEMFSRPSFMRLCRVCLGFVLTLAVVVAADRLIPSVVRYLETEGWRAGFPSLVSVIVYVGLIFLALVALASLIHPRTIVVERAAFGLSFLIIIVFLGGVVVYLLRWRHLVQVVGFTSPGLFTSVLCLFMILALLAVWSAGSDQTTADGEDTPQSEPSWIAGLDQQMVHALIAALLVAAAGGVVGLFFVKAGRRDIPKPAVTGAQRTRSTAARSEEVRADVRADRPSSAVRSRTKGPSYGTEAGGQPALDIGESQELAPLVSSVSTPIREPERPVFGPAHLGKEEEKEGSRSQKRGESQQGTGEVERRESTPDRTTGTKQGHRTLGVEGRLTLSVSPTDATIVLDNRELGEAWELREEISLRAGKHVLRVAKEGYITESHILHVRAGEEEQVRVALAAVPPQAQAAEQESEAVAEPSAGRSPPWLADRNLVRHVRNRNVSLFCHKMGCGAARRIESRLRQLGGRVTVQTISARGHAVRRSGVYYSAGQHGSAQAIEAVAEDIAALPLFRWDREREPISVYLLHEATR